MPLVVNAAAADVAHAQTSNRIAKRSAEATCAIPLACVAERVRCGNLQATWRVEMMTSILPYPPQAPNQCPRSVCLGYNMPSFHTGGGM